MRAGLAALLALGLLAGCTASSPAPTVDESSCVVATPEQWSSVIDAAPLIPAQDFTLSPAGLAVGWLDTAGPPVGTVDLNGSMTSLYSPESPADVAQVAVHENAAAVIVEHRVDLERPSTWELLLLDLRHPGSTPVVVATGTGSHATVTTDGHLRLTEDALVWIEGDHRSHELKHYDRRTRRTSVLHRGGPMLGITYHHEHHVHWVEEDPNDSRKSLVKGLDLATKEPLGPPEPLAGNDAVLRLAMEGDTVVWTDAPGRLTMWRTGWERPRRVVDAGFSAFFHQITFAGEFIIASKGADVWMVDRRSLSATHPEKVQLGRGFGHDLMALSVDPELPEFRSRAVSARTLTALPECGSPSASAS